MRRLYCLFDWNIQRDCFVKRGLTGMGIKLIVFIFTGLERHLINNFHSIPSLAYPVPKQLSSSCNHKSLLKEKETPERTSAQQNLVGLYFMLLRKSDGLGNFWGRIYRPNAANNNVYPFSTINGKMMSFSFIFEPVTFSSTTSSSFCWKYLTSPPVCCSPHSVSLHWDQVI